MSTQEQFEKVKAAILAGDEAQAKSAMGVPDNVPPSMPVEQLPEHQNALSMFIGMFLVVGFIAFLMKGIYGSSSDAEKRQTAQKQEQRKQENWIDLSQDAVRAKLKDGDSAEFRSVAYRDVQLAGKFVPIVCGQVNSKNSFGGFSGFQRFIASGSNTEFVFVEEMVSDFDKAWAQFCQ